MICAQSGGINYRPTNAHLVRRLDTHGRYDPAHAALAANAVAAATAAMTAFPRKQAFGRTLPHEAYVGLLARLKATPRGSSVQARVRSAAGGRAVSAIATAGWMMVETATTPWARLKTAGR
jgi:hypothetical protein